MKQIAATFIALILFSCTKESFYLPKLKVIYLDFDGGTVSTPYKNDTITVGASELTQEQQLEVLRLVRRDFDTFAVLVTTDSNLYATADRFARQRCLITKTWQWYGVTGGTSMINSFTWGDDTPCFVFSTLHKLRVSHIATATSHELGHTLGLRHHCGYDSSGKRIAEYVDAPYIMSAPYNYSRAYFVKAPGAYGKDKIQDDIAIISNILGFKKIF